MTANSTARLAVDIGGTFIDVVLEVGDRLVTAKLPTTADGPERAVLDGVARVLADGSVPPEQVGLFVHGTTLATNAIIERQGARIRLPLCCLGQVDPAASVAWVKGCIRPSDTIVFSLVRALRLPGCWTQGLAHRAAESAVTWGFVDSVGWGSKSHVLFRCRRFPWSERCVRSGVSRLQVFCK